ncbi:MAG: RNA-binding S4 domain-containing protein [Flavobacteriales bacterium]|nr:RNA-binding S4 domain-containing protein [Flavobacteriales bacterium]
MTDRSNSRRPKGGRTSRPTGPRPAGDKRRSSSSGPRERRERSGEDEERPRPDGTRSERSQGNGRPSRAGGARPPRVGHTGGERSGTREERPRSAGPQGGSRPRPARDRNERSGDRDERPASRSAKPGAARGERDERPRSAGTGRPQRPAAGRGRPVRNDEDRPASKRAGRRPPKAIREGGSYDTPRPERGWRERDASTKRFVGRGPDRASKRGKKAEEGIGDGRIRLNRYLSNAGVASRREADDLIKAGVVTVNGKIVTEMGTKVGPGDVIHYGGQKLSTEKKRYVLLNKPKDFITTTDDPRDRRTVMALIDDACSERLYPVGRLDRHTTGVLLMTNDGDLAKKLTHPSHGAEKIYHATLDKSLTKADLEKLVAGVQLDDGPAVADEASYVVGGTRKEVGLKIHMGRNRVVRRMFEALGYEVVKLDRVVFAGLTKKDLPRGKWRHLTEKEVLFLSKRK